MPRQKLYSILLSVDEGIPEGFSMVSKFLTKELF